MATSEPAGGVGPYGGLVEYQISGTPAGGGPNSVVKLQRFSKCPFPPSELV